MGLLRIADSPWIENQVILFVYGQSEESYYRAVAALINDDAAAPLAGNFAVVNQEMVVKTLSFSQERIDQGGVIEATEEAVPTATPGVTGRSTPAASPTPEAEVTAEPTVESEEATMTSPDAPPLLVYGAIAAAVVAAIAVGVAVISFQRRNKEPERTE
jgi:hypothetical protein